jgi:uncharacterized protein with HEPN domain
VRTVSRALLEDLLRTLDTIESFIQDQSFADYENNIMLRHAVERNLIAIGEILIRIRASDPDLAEMIPGGYALLGLRHRLGHGYDSEINDQIIWDGLTEEIPGLRRVTIELLESD